MEFQLFSFTYSFFLFPSKKDRSLFYPIYNCVSLGSGQVRWASLKKNTSAWQALQAGMGRIVFHRTSQQVATWQSEEKGVGNSTLPDTAYVEKPNIFCRNLADLFQIRNQTITGKWYISALIYILCISSSAVCCEGIQGKPFALNGLQLVSAPAVSQE